VFFYLFLCTVTDFSAAEKVVLNWLLVFGLTSIKRFVLCYCPVLSVTLVYCGQMVGRIKMKLGMEVGLGPGHSVLDDDPASPKGAQPPQFPCLLWSYGWMDQESRCQLVEMCKYNGY